MGEWIKCSDRLPHQDSRVLVWEKWSDSPFVGYLNQHGMWRADTEHYDADGGYSGATVISDVSQSLVTHWQPLPEPPHD